MNNMYLSFGYGIGNLCYDNNFGCSLADCIRMYNLNESQISDLLNGYEVVIDEDDDEYIYICD